MRMVLVGAVFAGLSAQACAGTVACLPEAGRLALELRGEVKAGERYTAPAGPGWMLALEPDPAGWIVRLWSPDGEDLARITPPYHFVPNPRDLHGWHFRNRANTGPNQGDVNAPQELRDFIFADRIDPAWPSAEVVAAAGGRGTLEITGYELSPPAEGERAHFIRLEFDACLSWPEDWGR